MKRAQFNLSSTKLLSCDMGELIPCGLTEVLPGDAFQGSTSALIRCAPMLAPVMHPVHVRIHHWFVPHRLVWADFEKFITGGPDGLDNTVFPTMPNVAGAAIGSLSDYLGIPTGVANLVHSALPLRGYALIWNEWYRDQDLQTPLVVSTGNGSDTTTSSILQNVCWEKDYFTSARPWEQKGAAVTIPLGTSAPITGLGFTNSVSGAASVTVRETTPLVDKVYPLFFDVGTSSSQIGVRGLGSGATSKPDVYADLAAVTGISVNTLRASLALQRFQEARAKYGSRYVEYLRALGVRSSDARLNRPEYLGGGKQTIQFSEVLATAETGATVDVGDMKGHGIAALRSNRFRTFFEEHGYIHTYISVKPKTIYGNGLFRHWNRRTKTDFWQKELQHIGQQAILNKEIYAPHATPDGTFGWQDRYDEYRRQESSIAGEFRGSLLDFWHLARIFSSTPALNASFVSSVPTERVFAVPSQDVLYIHARHSMQARRLVSHQGTSMTF